MGYVKTPFVFFVDADEYLLDLQHNQAFDVGLAKIDFLNRKASFLIPRIFRIKEGMEFITHYYIFPYGDMSIISSTFNDEKEQEKYYISATINHDNWIDEKKSEAKKKQLRQEVLRIKTIRENNKYVRPNFLDLRRQ